jgi:hypothetical protein
MSISIQMHICQFDKTPICQYPISNMSISIQMHICQFPYVKLTPGVNHNIHIDKNEVFTKQEKLTYEKLDKLVSGKLYRKLTKKEKVSRVMLYIGTIFWSPKSSLKKTTFESPLTQL